MLRRPGETDQDAIDRTSSDTIEVRDDGVWIIPNESYQPSSPDPDFQQGIIDLLAAISPRLRTERLDPNGIRLDDGDGPVVITVYDTEVKLKPPTGWRDPDGADGYGFHFMWRYATAIAEAFDCVAHDPDYSEIVDLSLDEHEARQVYGWL